MNRFGATFDNMTTAIEPEHLDALEARAHIEPIQFGPEELVTIIRMLRGYAARAEAAERAVEAARAYWEAEDGSIENIKRFADMIDAIAAYDATRGGSE